MQSVSTSPAKPSGYNLPKEKNNPKLAQVSPRVNINEVNSHVIEAILGSATRESQRGFGRIKNTIICADPTEVRVWCIV